MSLYRLMTMLFATTLYVGAGGGGGGANAVVAAAAAAADHTLSRPSTFPLVGFIPRHPLKSGNDHPLHTFTTRNLQETVAPTATAPPSAAESSDAQCLDDATVNFDDAFSLAVYGPTYEAICTCEEQDNTAEVTASLSTQPLPDNATATPEEIDAYMTNFNNAFGTLAGGYDYNCASGCATCFSDAIGDFCGILTTREATSFQGRVTNFTYTDLVGGGLTTLDPALLVSDSTYDAETCVTYESAETGQVCLAIAYAGVEGSSSTLPTCTITYDGEPCNNCAIQNSNATEEICYIADCTNFENTRTANLDSCTQTGFEGPFRVLQSLSQAQNGSTYTLGTCTESESSSSTNTSETLAPVVDDSTTSAPSATSGENGTSTSLPTTLAPTVTTVPGAETDTSTVSPTTTASTDPATTGSANDTNTTENENNSTSTNPSTNSTGTTSSTNGDTYENSTETNGTTNSSETNGTANSSETSGGQRPAMAAAAAVTATVSTTMMLTLYTSVFG